jgi:hypothetical protein
MEETEKQIEILRDRVDTLEAFIEDVLSVLINIHSQSDDGSFEALNELKADLITLTTPQYGSKL